MKAASVEASNHEKRTDAEEKARLRSGSTSGRCFGRKTIKQEVPMRFRIIAALFILVGVACLGLFAFLGSSVAPDGRLQEPFALLPLGWALILLGVAGLVVAWFVARSINLPPTKTRSTT